MADKPRHAAAGEAHKGRGGLSVASEWLAKARRSLTRKRYLLAVLVFLVLYSSSYIVWSRWLPAKEGVVAGRTWYVFVADDPDWEHTFFCLSYPLIKLDAAIGGRIHRFDVLYL